MQRCLGKVIFLRAQEEEAEREMGIMSIVSATELIDNEQPDFGKCTVRIVIALFEPQRLDFNL